MKLKKIIKIILILLIVAAFGTGIYFLVDYCLNVNEKIESMEPVKESNYFSLKRKTIIKNESYNINDFIEYCSIEGTICNTYKFEKEEMANYKDIGTYEIKIIADETITETTTLTIVENKEEQKKVEQQQKKEEETKKSVTPSAERTKTETKEEISENIETKFGTKIIKKTITTYDYYSDGTKEKRNEKDEVSYDYSTYNASIDELSREVKDYLSESMEITNEGFKELNELRVTNGLQEITPDITIQNAAYIRAMEILWSNNRSNTRPNGNTALEVVQYYMPSASSMAEFIFTGNTEAELKVQIYENERFITTLISNDFNKVGTGAIEKDGEICLVYIFTN